MHAVDTEVTNTAVAEEMDNSCSSPKHENHGRGRETNSDTSVSDKESRDFESEENTALGGKVHAQDLFLILYFNMYALVMSSGYIYS